MMPHHYTSLREIFRASEELLERFKSQTVKHKYYDIFTNSGIRVWTGFSIHTYVNVKKIRVHAS